MRRTTLNIFFVIIHHSICNTVFEQKPSIIIIGAGSSAIAAATKLYKNGFTDLQILEYENRIGGRVHTLEFGDNFIELGAQWCHGIKDNVVYELASSYLDTNNEIILLNNTRLIQSNGNILSNDMLQEQLNIFEDLRDSDELSEYSGTLEEYFKTRYIRIAQSLNISEELQIEFLNLFEKLICDDGAMDSWSKQTGVGYAIYEDSEGLQTINWNGNGYKTILDILMERNSTLESEINNRIQFNKDVININYSNNNKIIVKTSDDSAYYADKVIVTISLGVLKERHKTLFNPTLPPKNQQAIENLSFGVINKIILEFETRWWPNDWQGFHILWTSDQLKILQESNSWLPSLMNVEKIEHQSKSLVGWICGSKTKEYERFSDETIKNDVLELLNKLLGTTYNITKLKTFKRTKWWSKPNFRGSYSYHSIESVKLNITNMDLAEPVKNSNGQNSVYFAGEATNDNHFATVHGAIESGWRAAKELIADHKHFTSLML